MALANVAYELCKKDLRVLMVDWDLEAPGLERYFSNFITEQQQGNGLLPMLSKVGGITAPNYRDYIWHIDVKLKQPIALLHSGREKDPDYSRTLETFDWKKFFAVDYGGAFLEQLRAQWKKDFDIVLIDSRTGLSDASGICTILLPDILIPMFTANYQSLFGVRDIVRLAQEARQKLDVDRLPLTILPLPARFGTRAEFQQSQLWLKEFADHLKEFYTDWLPRWIEPRQVLEKIKVPQVEYFSFGEKLAVVEQGTDDPEGMGYIYSKVAGLLASDFQDIDVLIGEKQVTQKMEFEKKQQAKPVQKPAASRGTSYEHDFYISYMPSQINEQWISQTFLPLFTDTLENLLPSSPRIFFDRTEILYENNFPDVLQHALLRSKVLIAIVGPAYFGRTKTLTEWLTFTRKEQQLNYSPLILPVIIRKMDPVHPLLAKRQYLDLSGFSLVGEAFFKSDKYLDLQYHMQRFVDEVSKIIQLVPPFVPDIRVPSFEEVQAVVKQADGPDPFTRVFE